MTDVTIGLGTARVGDEEQIVVRVGERLVPFGDLFAGEAVPAAMTDLIARWPEWRDRVLALGDGSTGDLPALEDGTFEWLAPVMPEKLICIGTNYADHVAEMSAATGVGTASGPFPYGFMKPPATTLVGSGHPVALPSYAEKVDWEAELAVIIGDPARAGSSDPLRGVFGYSIFNDLSVRDYVPFPHVLGLDAIVSKGFDGAAPMGPWITPAELVGDPQQLGIKLRVGGEVRQNSSTEQMIFSVREIVGHYARVLTLEPGDVIATGTPAGVGAGRNPPEFLKGGDEIEVEIGNLGRLQTPIVAAKRHVSLKIREE